MSPTKQNVQAELESLREQIRYHEYRYYEVSSPCLRVSVVNEFR